MKTRWLLGCAVVAWCAGGLASRAHAGCIVGYAEVGGLGELGNFIYVTFAADVPVRLVRVTYNFDGTLVNYDADEASFVPTVNNGLRSYTFFPDVDSQIFGFRASGFDSNDSLQLGLGLDRGSTGSPLKEDYFKGRVTVEFSNGKVITAAFSREGRNAFSAIADFSAAVRPFLFKRARRRVPRAIFRSTLIPGGLKPWGRARF
ncbi:MAG: hypothetical protein ACYTG0_43385 [Planctomycetota bacterium]|jgi:hypothetical protein